METIDANNYEFVVGPITKKEFRSRWLVQLTDEILIVRNQIKLSLTIGFYQGEVFLLVAQVNIKHAKQGARLTGKVWLNDEGETDFNVCVSRAEMEQKARKSLHNFSQGVYDEAIKKSGPDLNIRFVLANVVPIVMDKAVSRKSVIIPPDEDEPIAGAPEETKAGEEKDGNRNEDHEEDDSRMDNIVPATVPHTIDS